MASHPPAVEASQRAAWHLECISPWQQASGLSLLRRHVGVAHSSRSSVAPAGKRLQKVVLQFYFAIILVMVCMSPLNNSDVGLAVLGIRASMSLGKSKVAHQPFEAHAHARQEHRMRAAQEVLLQADAVCFDVDSTIIETEGIDVLAECFGVYEEVASLTHTAMEGNLEFQDALAQRLDIIRPIQHRVQECLIQERPVLTSGIAELILLLRLHGKDVHLVSGGFKVMIDPVADRLGISRDNIWANTILFDKNGEYTGFDRNQPTSRSGGKAEVIQMLKHKKSYDSVVMIGDGSTDLDASPPADTFIGYGGVHVRPTVKDGADWFVTSWRDVITVLAKPQSLRQL